jgi:hypothetical protein
MMIAARTARQRLAPSNDHIGHFAGFPPMSDATEYAVGIVSGAGLN